MKCPWKLNVPANIRYDEECDPGCAWLMERDGDYQYCAVAVLAASGTEEMGFCPANSMERRGQ